ncbi:phosphoribosylaminoimidazole synthetase [Amycolatopsis panacis]|uniref:Phosphoribosylaminoimidazole synthetase n=1 Tax=Amycolatopsis panacis TaxID=2340917 RepID=A0A419HJT3_9PSEU|nr:phosphoribosylaminoimidazole synthetase [Amycolatopsis panacis]RJQ76071.1 phosphoribosylaminoimidazole synthetase [Amycolatopsis panacis]
MIVRCIFNTGEQIGLLEHGLHFGDQTRFEVKVGTKYPVYGMSMFNRGLTALIRGETERPNWYPIELFEVVDGGLPAKWRFATRDEGESWTQAIWGYPELVDDPGHADALIEREVEALTVFAAQVGARHEEFRGE